MTRFGIIGTGRRARFFLRLTRMAPEHLTVAGVVSRNPAGASDFDVTAYGTLAELASATRPDFVVAAVPWEQMPAATSEAVGLGLRVLSETPPAPTADGLRSLWAAVGASGLVQVGEQYLLMPGHAARLAVARRATIGDVTSVQVCSTHAYHATSLMRGFLGAGFEPVHVDARSFAAPLADPLGPQGWSGDDTPAPRATTLATLDFGGGRHGLYDFTDNQWFNPLRARRIVVRGTRGEIVDDAVTRLADARTPVCSTLMRRQLGVDLELEGVGLDHISADGEVAYRNPFLGARMSDDDLAVATILRDTGRWARDEGPAPYPLAQGCQDHLLGLAIDESARTGRPVVTAREAWAD